MARISMAAISTLLLCVFLSAPRLVEEVRAQQAVVAPPVPPRTTTSNNVTSGSTANGGVQTPSSSAFQDPAAPPPALSFRQPSPPLLPPARVQTTTTTTTTNETTSNRFAALFPRPVSTAAAAAASTTTTTSTSSSTMPRSVPLPPQPSAAEEEKDDEEAIVVQPAVVAAKANDDMDLGNIAFPSPGSNPAGGAPEEKALPSNLMNLEMSNAEWTDGNPIAVPARALPRDSDVGGSMPDAASLGDAIAAGSAQFGAANPDVAGDYIDAPPIDGGGMPTSSAVSEPPQMMMGGGGGQGAANPDVAGDYIDAPPIGGGGMPTSSAVSEPPQMMMGGGGQGGGGAESMPSPVMGNAAGAGAQPGQQLTEAQYNGLAAWHANRAMLRLREAMALQRYSPGRAAFLMGQAKMHKDESEKNKALAESMG